MTTSTETQLAVAQELVELCRKGENLAALETLYSPEIVSVEAEPMPGAESRESVGLEAVIAKNKWWFENHELHGGTVEGPFPHDDRFIVMMSYDVTPKAGPLAGQRMTFAEAGLYTIADGKIVREEFFYGGK